MARRLPRNEKGDPDRRLPRETSLRQKLDNRIHVQRKLLRDYESLAHRRRKDTRSALGSVIRRIHAVADIAGVPRDFDEFGDKGYYTALKRLDLMASKINEGNKQ